MGTGYFTWDGNHSTVHLVDENNIPICGTKPKGVYQWCSMHLEYSYLTCEKCKVKARKIMQERKEKDLKIFDNKPNNKMFEITDLRIGNYMFDNQGRLCSVEELTRIEFTAPAMSGAVTSLPNKAIELNHKHLVNLGFEHMSYEYKIDGLIIGIRTKHKGFCYGGVRIYYVHQLQNLYHIRTGNELKYNINYL